jgi:putative toxin-antitoxin system antitoxin component (TIGR02293 family)
MTTTHKATPDKATAQQKRSDLGEIRFCIQTGRGQGYFHVALLGLRTYDLYELHKQVHKGFRYSTFGRFQRNTKLSAKMLSELTRIRPRTLTRRKVNGKFNPEESDRLLRVSRVFGLALGLFEGDDEAAYAWLSSRQSALGNLVPLELAKSDVGVEEIEKLIGRLEYGIPV